ncbi:MAG: hypothetical protein AB1659_03230 [Thermodesulfobacteriota bacterium]
MSTSEKKDFREKHSRDLQPDAAVRAEIEKRIKENQLSCAAAFEISKETGISIDKIGQTADLLRIRLAKCQLGLFGYEPKKKIVHALPDLDPILSRAISDARVEGKLTCRAAWEIAARLKIPRLSVGNACESMKIKIKSCQLGAF